MTAKWRGFSVVVAGIIVHLTLGTIYTFGNMTPYITSYLRQKDIDNDLTYSKSIWIFSSAAMGQGASMFIGGFMYEKIGPRWTTLIGSWISSGGVALTYFSVQKSFELVVATYGLMFGLGVGIAYAVPINCGHKWFPTHKGLVSGLVVAGFGSGAFVFDQIQTVFLNPENKEADLKVGGDKYFTENAVLKKVPSCFLLLGGCYAALQLIGCLMLADPPHQYQQLQQNMGAEEDEGVVQNTESEPNFTWREAITKTAFYQLWFIYLFNGQGIQFVSGLYKAYGQSFIKDDHFLAIVGSLAAVCNGSGRIMWGHLADKYSFRLAMMLSCGSFAALTLSFGLTSLSGKGLYLIYVCLLFLCFSGNFSLLPTATSKAFGLRNYSIIYGLVFTASVITSPIGAILSDNLKSVIGWYWMFIMCAAFSLISVIISFKFNVRKSNGQHI
ncbi:apicoplast pyruvate carrier 1-like isoform X1 [Mytilus edulis]